MPQLLSSAPRRRAVALVGLLSVLALLPTSALADDGLAAGSTGTLSAGTALRTAPGFDAPAATEVAPGAELTVADGPLTAADGSLWYQVDVWGQVGYVPTYAVSGASTETGTVETTDAAVPMGTDDVAAAVSEPVDSGVPAEATEPADAAAMMPESSEASETAAPIDATGDAFQAFETTDTLIEQPAPTAPTGTVYITGTDGDGAACRGEASYAAPTLATLPEGTVVDALGEATGEWQPVACGGGTGYVNGAYVSWETADAAPMGLESPVEQAETELAAPAEPTTPEAEEPATTEEPAIAAPVAAEEPAPVAVEEPAAAETARGAAPGGGSGQAVADFAMGFVGYPYVYAGASPAGFDCSGFTMYVVQQTLGMAIPHDTAAQSGVGTPVGKGELQPGDLVFFQNTFAPGVSHAGVYIGGGQFVHSENEATGVKVSDINSSYYAEHWYGAKRLV